MNWQSREDERVARALDGAPPPHERADRVVLALAERVREVPADAGLDAAPGFRDALRARLLAEGAALLPHPRDPDPLDAGPPAPPGRRARPAAGPPRGRTTDRARVRRRRIAAVTVLTAAMLSAGALSASTGARPGDPLYGLKRRVQEVEVALARGDVDRGRRHLERARTRVRELGTAGTSARPGPLVATLDDMDSDTRTGVRLLSTVAVRRDDATRLTQLGVWTTEQRSLLATAAGRLPAAARDRAVGSLALLGDIAARVTSLEGALRCDCPPAVPVDDLGPVPCRDCGRGTSEPSVPPAATRWPSTVPVPTAAASRLAPTVSTRLPSLVPSAGGRVPIPPAAPTGGLQPSARPPVDVTSPAPAPVPAAPTVPPSPTPGPVPGPTVPAVVPDRIATDLLDGLPDGLVDAVGPGGP